MSRSVYKRVSELSAWDLDRSCRPFVNQSSPANRRLKKKIRRADRKRLDSHTKKCYNEDVERSDNNA